MGGTRTPATGAKSTPGGEAAGARTPMSRRKADGAPRTPLGTISASSNVAPGALPSPGAPRSPRREAAPASPRWISTAGSPGLNDSLVAEHVSYIADTLAREPTDEDAHQQLRSAIKARHENEALRERLEHLKNSEIDQGLAASERMREMSSEYVHRVDHLTREKDTARARAEAAEARARELQDVLRANGIEVPKGPERSGPPADDEAQDPDVSIGDGGVSATFPPAAALFDSPSPAHADLELAMTRDGLGEPDASFDFGGGAFFASASDAAESEHSENADASIASLLDSDALRVGADEAALSATDVIRTPRGDDVSSSRGVAGLHAASTPSGDAAEAAAREAMATLDHPALVDEASNLVATNVRLERERRALVGRLETLMKARVSTPTAGSTAGERVGVRSARDRDDDDVPFDPANAVRAATQLSEALDRVAAAASRAATLLDADVSPSSSAGPSTPVASRQSTPGGTLSKALRRMKAHGHGVNAEGSEEDRRREALEAAEEASAAASLASMQRDLLMEALEAAPPRLAPTPEPPRVESTRAPGASPPAAPLDVISTPPAPQPPSAAQAATARAEKAERELVQLRRQLAAEASRANEDRVESRYAAAQSKREVERLTAELAAATTAAQTAQDIAARRQRQAANLEAKHTRLSIELSTAMQALREAEREARAEEKRASLSFRIDTPAPNAAVSQSPLVVVGTPPDLAPIRTGAKIKASASGSAEAKLRSPIASLVRQVSATREGLAAALAAADAAAEAEDTEDETAALVRDLRAQLERARADAAAALARAEAAEGAAAPEAASPSSPSPSPIARERDAMDDAALDEAADELGMNGAEWSSNADAALASAKAEAASATAAAETLRGELSRARDALASGAEEQERLGLELERAREEEARLSLSLEQAKHALETFTTASSAEVSRLAAELEAATSAKTAAEEALEMAKRAAKAWKAQQTSAVERWMEAATARAVAAESALAERSELDNSEGGLEARGSDGNASDYPSLVAENRELTALAERRATEAETLELRVAELAERAEAAEKSAADAPHLRAENYDLAVKHRAGLRRLHQELTARRELEERVQGYEHATAALEATVKQLEVALKQAMDMCAEAKAASAAAASERAAAEARSPLAAASDAGTPASSRGSVDGGSASPDDRALAARAETLAAAVEAAERDAAAAREETARANAAAAAAALEAKNALEVAEARRADLAVLRDECSKLRWKVLEMEEDARVSPSPRHGGRPREPLPSDSPFASMKTFGRFAEAEAASPSGDGFSLADAFVDPDETLALTPPVQGRGAGSETAVLDLDALDAEREREAAKKTREAAEEVSRAADAVRAENEALAARLAEARAETARLTVETSAAREEAAASASRAEAAEARAQRLSASVAEKARQAEQASAELDAATFAKTSAEAAARAREDDAAEAKAAVKALRAERRALETVAAEASAARAAAECAAAEARREASEARAEAMREASAAEAAHEARRRAEEEAARLAKHAASEAADAAATSPKPPALAFRARVDAPAPSTALALRPAETSAEAAAAAALAAMAATAVPADAEAFAATLREYTRRLREDAARARDEVAAHKARAARMKAEIDRLATDLPSHRHGERASTRALPESSPKAPLARDSTAEPPAADPTRAAYYKSVAKKCYARMKSQKAAYELQIAGLRQQIELVALPSLNTTNASFAATPTPRRARRMGSFSTRTGDDDDNLNETPQTNAGKT